MDTSASLTDCTKLGAYTIREHLGSGGMGDVYRAHDAKLGRDVAIKIVRPALVSDPDHLARLHREARILASLNHPGIATIYGLDESANMPAIVMELVDAPTLADRIRRDPIPVPEALEIAMQIAAAVEYAHERGVVHRDLKPENIKLVKLASQATVKILDFGLARALETDDAASAAAATVTHARGVVLGTPAYMSPEQATGGAIESPRRRVGARLHRLRNAERCTELVRRAEEARAFGQVSIA